MEKLGGAIVSRGLASRLARISAFAAMILPLASAVSAEERATSAGNEPRETTEERAQWLERVEHARDHYEAFAARAAAGAHASSGEGIETAAEPRHLTDDTLRAGDVVATKEGLLLFKGSMRFPYGETDFEPLGERPAPSLPHRNVLLELMRTGADRAR